MIKNYSSNFRNSFLRGTILFILFLTNFLGFSQSCTTLMSELSLETRFSEADVVVEAEVNTVNSYWDTKKKGIYTVYDLKIYQKIKGDLGKSIKLVFLGGTVGDVTMAVSSSIKFSKGDQGIFFLKESQVDLLTAEKKYSLIGAAQGVIKFHYRNGSASDVFKKYDSVITDLYPVIQKIANKKWETVQFKPIRKWATSGTPGGITSFFPTTATAGTKQLLTINGTGFGTTTGNVLFANADNGGATFTPASPSQILTWSDTQITVEIPDLAGTGKIQVDNGAICESATDLNVDYAYTNFINATTVFSTLIGDDNGRGGLTFLYHTDFDSSPAKPLFEEAFEKWNCETNINFELGGVTTNDTADGDNENVIRFDNGTELPLGVLGQVISWYSNSCTPTQELFTFEIDIRWNDTTNWFYGSGTPGPTQFDFKSVALHELGHAHQLNHVINPSDVMHFNFGTGASNFNLSPENITSGKLRVEEFVDGDGCSISNMTKEVYCCDDTNIDQDPENISIQEATNGIFSVKENLVNAYQWQINTGSGWSDLANDTIYSGVTTSQITISNVTIAMDGHLFRCILSRSCGDELTTDEATLGVLSASTDPNAFITEWDTENLGTSTNTQITIPTNPALTYNYTVDWGDGTIENNITGDVTHTFSNAGEKIIAITGDFPAIYFNNTGDRLKIIQVLQWGNVSWRSFENAFYGCSNFNFDAIPAPDLSQVESFKNIFKVDRREPTIFNGILNRWDVSNVTDMSGAFENAANFNRPLDDWNTSSVTDMSRMFFATDFNQPIDIWDTSKVITMASMFEENDKFNQPIGSWDVGLVMDMSRMFDGNKVFNQFIGNWNVSSVTNMSYMFHDFQFVDFNQPIGNWDVSNVTDMSYMFSSTSTTHRFNQPLRDWDVSSVRNMEGMFENANFNQDISIWNVSSVTNMEKMFEDSQFDQPIGNWNVSSVTNMRGMFDRGVFNQPIGDWDVSSVTNMERMFQFNTVFNQPIGDWDVSQVTNTISMFSRATAFNQPLNTWNTSMLRSISNMFGGATAFNQPIENWNISGVTNLITMFSGATSFNQSLATWDVSNVSSMSSMLDNSGLSEANYDATLIAWSNLTLRNRVRLGALNLIYCNSIAERQKLIDDFEWIITGDSECATIKCITPIAPLEGDTNVPANFNLVWEDIDIATGYVINVRKEVGGVSIPVVTNERVGKVSEYDFPTDFSVGDIVFVTIAPFNTTEEATGCTEISFTIVAPWSEGTSSFITTWDTRNQQFDTTGNNQVLINTNRDFTYNFSIEWGDGKFDNNVTSSIIHNYDTPGVYQIAIIGDFPAFTVGRNISDRNTKLLSIDQWGTIEWQTMERSFSGCELMAYNATDIPDLSATTSLSYMFDDCALFNGAIGNWNVSTITDMSFMFGRTDNFNQSIETWDVSNVENMAFMFNSANSFNQPLEAWDVSKVTSMRRMFSFARAFNQPLESWGAKIGLVTSMEGMFQGTILFNQPLNSWDVSNVMDMSEMFRQAVAFNQPLGGWNVSNVTDMSSMFSRATSFNAPIGSWNVSNVTDMSNMFSDTPFNQPIENWNTSRVTNMAGMFTRAPFFNQPINTNGTNWNVSSVTNMSNMFSGASAFNQAIDQWDVSSVTNTSGMFRSAIVFNSNIGGWNVGSVTNMSSMFEDAEDFNQDLNTWNVSSVVNMSSMFQSAETFEGNISDWVVSAVSNMSEMFRGALVFNQPIINWDVSSVTLMNSMFEDAQVFNQPIGNWDVGDVTDMNGMFRSALVFNEPIGNWNTALVSNMAGMFDNARAFNQNISDWNVGDVTNMRRMFRRAVSYNQPMNTNGTKWNVNIVTNMSEMFSGATVFNQDLNNWNVGVVTNMSSMFSEATVFNGENSNWEVGNVTDMSFMFNNARAFNQPVGNWNVAEVTLMRSMFNGAEAFNQPINNWDVSSVTNMNSMFRDTLVFNQLLENWNVTSVTDMSNMFDGALVYDQPLSGWDISSVERMSSMLDDTALSLMNYDNTLIAWNQLTLQSNVTFGARGLEYCEAEEERNDIRTRFSWNFFGDSLGCPIPACTSLELPLNGAVDVPVNTNLRWSPVIYAKTYRVRVETVPGGVIVNDETVVVGSELVTPVTYNFASDFAGGELVNVTITPFNTFGEPMTACITESFTIINNPTPMVPDCPIITTPADMAMSVDIETIINWSPIANADNYRITIGTTPGGTEIENNRDVGNVTTFTPSMELPEGATIYVTINPENAVGVNTTCIEISFETESNCIVMGPPIPDIASLPLLSDQCSIAMPTAPTATDNCGSTVTGTTTTTFPIRTQGAATIIWTFDNGAGDTITQNQSVNIEDTEAPVPNTMSLANATGQCEVTSLTPPTATDNCSGTITGTTTITFPLSSSTTVTWTYDDGNGNTITQNQEVVINDTTNPVPDTVSLSTLTNECEITGATPPTATDNCNGSIIGTTTVIFPITTNTTIIWTYDDGNGNTITQNQEVIINDTIDPVPNATTLNNVVSECAVESIVAPTATDNCASVITGTTTTVFPIEVEGTTIVTWSFTDGNSNTINQTQNVIIDDITKPVPDILNLPDITSECTVTSLTAPTATDNCEGTITATTNALLPIEGEGTTTIVTWTYDDGNGNTETQTQNIIINDTTSPVADVISLPDINAQCEVTSLTPPTATDNCEGIITATSNAILPIIGEGTTVVTWTYDDGNGNTETQTQNIIIDDTIAPVADTLTLPDITDQCEVTSLVSPTATDNCEGIITATSNTILPIKGEGITTIIWTYDDGKGNTSTQTQNIVIDDTSDPVPDAVTLLEITDQCEINSLIVPTAIDNCSNAVTVTNDATFPITTQGTTIVTWTYDDGNGNTTTQSQNVVINDTTDPIPDATSLDNVMGLCEVTSLTPPNVTDNCSSSITITNDAVLPITAIGTTVVTWTYDDGNGNTVTQPQNVILTGPLEAQELQDIDVCNTYILPNLSEGNNYFTASNQGGVQLLVGQEITSTQTIFIHRGTSTCFNESEFTVTINEEICEVPLCTTLISPENNSTNISVDTDLEWNPVIDATGYLLNIGTSPESNDIVDNEDVGNTIRYLFTSSLPEDTIFYIKITPYNADGEAESCFEESFMTTRTDATKFGFSPNGDGINDVWEIDNIQEFPNNEVYIYNRWGDLVYQTKSYNNLDRVFTGEANRGKSLGASKLPSGTYFFKIDITGSHNLKKTKGFLVLKR